MGPPSSSDLPPPADASTSRHALSPESELRLEIPVGVSCTVTLLRGSAELFGAELAPHRPLSLTGRKAAIFTWHGCTLDVSNKDQLDIEYVSEETEANVAYVNTHAQLEAMRDEALASAMSSADGANVLHDKPTEGPRVLLAGPADCGKSSLARVLAAYATKLGRSPLLVDLDASNNMLSVPGTLAAIPVTTDIASAEGYATSSVMSGTGHGAPMPLVLWYGSQDLPAHPDLYKAQLEKLGKSIDERLAGEAEAGASGVIVNTSGYIEDVGYEYLLHAIDALRINVVLVLGHDRLYSMLGKEFKQKAQQMEEGSAPRTVPKLIKLPRSGGVVSRDAAFRRASRSSCIRRYFYGNNNALSPCLIDVSLSDIQLHKLSNISLSASLLPISAKQATDPIQLTNIQPSEITPKFQHSVLAVCHPSAVAKYEQSGSARDLYLAGVAGFVVVEKVDAEKGSLGLLSPCAGSLPSSHLLVGDIFWLE